MADDAAGAQAERKTKGLRRYTQWIVVALVMIGEGVGIFFIANAMQAAPEIAKASGRAGGEGRAGVVGADGTSSPMREVDLAECNPSNNTSGKLISLRLRVSGLVSPTDFELVEALVEEKRARIHDRVNFVIRSAALRHLNEPGLETIKRRIKHELDGLFGEEGMVKEVFIPELLQSGPGL